MLAPKARSTGLNLPNQFERLYVDLDTSEHADKRLPTEYYTDHTRSILAENTSPDIEFRYSMNPYRGCEHGCIYCYARPTHEYLGYSAGLDFETKIFVKQRAPELLNRALRRPGWEPQVIALAGNTDCYQHIERKLEITRNCLKVFLDYRNPLGIITKSHLICRDSDLLNELAEYRLVNVTVSITTLRPELAKAMEPRASWPERRLNTIAHLAQAGIPIGVNVAPVIPGLNDDEIPSIIKAAADAGARWVNYILLRLQGAVEPLFLNWLANTFPERSNKVLNQLRAFRSGALSDASFGGRMCGVGKPAQLLKRYFEISRGKYGLEPGALALSIDGFRRPNRHQLELKF